MKHHSVIATLVVAVFLWVGYNNAFAAELVWQTSKEYAVPMAISQGKKILLIGGDSSCARTEAMIHTVCESVSPPIKSLIEQYFIPWFGDRSTALNGLLTNTDWYRYAIGINGTGSFDFPLICVIDPNDSNIWMGNAYLYRAAGLPIVSGTTNVLDLAGFYARLLPFANSNIECAVNMYPSAYTCNASSNTGTINITPSSSNCSWTAYSNFSWITITAGSAGTGNGTVSYSVSANTTGSTRTGTLTIGGQTFTVTQNASSTCACTIFPTSVLFNVSSNRTPFGDMSNMGTVTVTSASGCSWSATSNASWITITAGSTGTGDGTVSYSASANTTGSTRTGTLTIEGQTFTITQNVSSTPLYFPHVDTSLPWQTEIAIINTGDQTVTGTLKALNDKGQLVGTLGVTLSARGRRQISVANEFTNSTDIGYIIFDTDSAAVQGYTKLYQTGSYRTAIPATKKLNTSDIYVPHIASDADWWTGVSLVNTTPATKVLTIAFNNGQSVPYTLNANEHKVFDIASLFDNQPQPGIQSAVVNNTSGVIGLELFGSTVGGNKMEGIPLTDKTISTIYYPHVAGNDWWTGIVAYNPSDLASTITITPYSAQGDSFPSSTLSIAGKGKYIGAVSDLGLPAQTAWFKIDASRPLSGFELFGTVNGNQLAAYEGGGTGAKAGVFAKIEKNGWTGIAFVNTEDNAASVTLTAYNDSGTALATSTISIGGHAKVVNPAGNLFLQDISSATYIAFSSDRNVVGFQLNGSSDGTMLDGLPALAGTN
jgi:hypothetical protein